MDKVANRAFRRAVELFKGRHIPGKMTNYGVADLSKPMWERRGFDSQEDMMNAWRASKIAKGIDSFAGSLDGTDALKDLDYSVGGRVKTFLSNLFGKKPSTVEAPLGRRMNQNDLKLAYEHFDANPRLSGESTYSDAVSDYIKRRVKNDPALKRFNSLMRRYRTLRRSDAMSEWRGRLNGTPEGFLNYPFSVKGPEEGLDAAMPRVHDKLLNLRRRKEARPASWPFLAEVAPAVGLARESGGSIIRLPVLATFRANGPFATTYHAADYHTTKRAMDAMDNAVDHLRSNGQPITSENVHNTMPKSIGLPFGRDLTPARDVRVHVGDKYPDDIMQDLREGYFGDRVDPNYEAVWPLGAPDYPNMTALHAEDSPQFRRVADEAGLSHIFKRDAVTPPQLQAADDMVLYKGTPIPTVEEALPVFSEGAADLTDEISTAYKDALQSHLKRGFGAPSYGEGGISSVRRMPRTILGTLLDFPGHKKYPLNEPSWLTPSAVTAAGYGKKSAEMQLLPITKDEARQLFSPRIVNKSVKDLLDDVTPEERKQIADLVRHYGDFKQTEQFKDVVNKNIEQISDVMPRIKQNVPEPILRALQGDNSMLPADMSNYSLFNKPDLDIIRAILNTN